MWVTMAVETIGTACSTAGVVGWFVSAGDMSRLPALLTTDAVKIDKSLADGVPLSIVSRPLGAGLEIDGVR
jgi:hypothetical protein